MGKSENRMFSPKLKQETVRLTQTSERTIGQTVGQLHTGRGFDGIQKSDIEMSIPTLFKRQVCAFPRRAAVDCGRQLLSYGEFDRVSNRIANAILCRRGDKEEPAVLLFRQGPAAAVATIGSLKSGKIYVPLDPNQPVRELQQMMTHCRPGLIICDSETEALAKCLMKSSDCHLNVETMAADEPETDPDLHLLPDRISHIFYTSGTTGTPKGVYDNHRNVVHNVMRYTNTLGICANDRLSLIQPCSFSGTVSSMFSAILNGATVCPFDLQRHGIARMAGWIEEQGITVFHSTPGIFEQLLATGCKFNTLRIIRLEGDRAEPRQISLFRSHFDTNCVLVNGLGLTEAGIVRQYFVTKQTRIDGPVVPVGYAVEDFEVNLVDAEGRNVEQGMVGEIVIRSEYLACGYWQNPTLTKAAFLPDSRDSRMRGYRTGDLGRMRTDGCLDYLGRKDFQAKIRGQWVNFAKIESTLCSIQSVSRALALVRDSESGVQQLVAYLVVEGVPPSISSIRDQLGQTLPAVMLPSRYVFIPSMPLDRNGKIDRYRLPAPGRQRPILEQTFVAPRSRVESIIAECFSSILNIDRVGRHDDFIDLGGDSLSAVELLLMIEERLGVDCRNFLIGEHFNPASFADQLAQSLPESAAIEIQAGDGRAPLFCIHSQGGDVRQYFRLARFLDPEQTVYGLQSRTYTKAGIIDTRVEDMATAYAAEITTIEPKGPYYLCGNCFGGTVAFEIAQQLRLQGRDVALLALIDTEFPIGAIHNPANRNNRYRALAPLTKQRLSIFSQRFQDVASRAKSKIKQNLRWIKNRGSSCGKQPNFDRGGVVWRCTRAHDRYNPQRYDDHIVLICPGPPHNQRGWIDLAPGKCIVIEIPLDEQPTTSPHLTDVPYVAKLAAHISAFL